LAVRPDHSSTGRRGNKPLPGPISRHISYANVAATLALLFSMSGGALAAQHYLISSTNQISPKVLNKLKGHTGQEGAAGTTGKEGLPGREGPQGKEGPQGPPGAAGAPGTALAYAHVSPEGVLEAANSENAGTVVHPSEGVYCFSHLSFTPHNVVVSLDWNSAAGKAPSISASLGVGTSSGCPEGTQITVGTGETTGMVNRGFFILVN
jgi:hypothetical protein